MATAWVRSLLSKSVPLPLLPIKRRLKQERCVTTTNVSVRETRHTQDNYEGYSSVEGYSRRWWNQSQHFYYRRWSPRNRDETVTQCALLQLTFVSSYFPSLLWSDSRILKTAFLPFLSHRHENYGKSVFLYTCISFTVYNSCLFHNFFFLGTHYLKSFSVFLDPGRSIGNSVKK